MHYISTALHQCTPYAPGPLCSISACAMCPILALGSIRARLQGNYSDLLVSLSGIYSKLRGDTTGEKNEDAAQVCGCGSGRRCGCGCGWVRPEVRAASRQNVAP